MMEQMDLKALNVGDALPVREFHCDNVGQFLYNAAIWNAHRIHFDQAYATEVEAYPGLVVAGPLMGDWLTQVATEWMGETGRLLSFEYSNRRAAYTGETLRSTGQVASLDLESGIVGLSLQILNAGGDIVAPGHAEVQFPVT